jgi:hypothetical protein
MRRSLTRGTPSLSPPPWVRFRGEADIIRQANPAELVENDPDMDADAVKSTTGVAETA